MANSPQAIKRARQILKRTLHNQMQKSAMRTAVKNIDKVINTGNSDDIKQAQNRANKLIAKLAGRRIIHPNTAARMKSRLNQRIKKATQ